MIHVYLKIYGENFRNLQKGAPRKNKKVMKEFLTSFAGKNYTNFPSTDIKLMRDVEMPKISVKTKAKKEKESMTKLWFVKSARSSSTTSVIAKTSSTKNMKTKRTTTIKSTSKAVQKSNKKMTENVKTKITTKSTTTRSKTTIVAVGSSGQTADPNMLDMIHDSIEDNDTTKSTTTRPKTTTVVVPTTAASDVLDVIQDSNEDNATKGSEVEMKEKRTEGSATKEQTTELGNSHASKGFLCTLPPIIIKSSVKTTF